MEVICSCNHDRVSTDAIEFLNIEEGMRGEDIVTFICPFCGDEHKSVVLASIEEANGAFWNDQLPDMYAD